MLRPAHVNSSYMNSCRSVDGGEGTKRRKMLPSHPSAVVCPPSPASVFIATRSGFGIGRARPPGHEGDPHMRLHQQLVAAQHLLLERDRGALDLFVFGDDLEHVVHPRRLEELDLHRAHHEGEARRLALGFLEQAALIGTEKPQMVRAPALQETQVVGVIDDAGKVGVLVIDPHRHHVPAIANLAVESERIHPRALPTASNTLAAPAAQRHENDLRRHAETERHDAAAEPARDDQITSLAHMAIREPVAVA